MGGVCDWGGGAWGGGWGGGGGVCVCVCLCVRACVRVCVCPITPHTPLGLKARRPFDNHVTCNLTGWGPGCLTRSVHAAVVRSIPLSGTADPEIKVPPPSPLPLTPPLGAQGYQRFPLSEPVVGQNTMYSFALLLRLLRGRRPSLPSLFHHDAFNFISFLKLLRS